MKMKRRTFLQGCCSSIMALAGARLGNLTFGQGPGNRDIIVSVFLRGGMDALSLLAPWSDTEYHQARSRLGLDAANVIDLNGYFGINKGADKLATLYNAGHLAFIPACGFPEANRSHFDAQDIMDRGLTGSAAKTGDGWLARHLVPSSPMDSVFRAVSLNGAASISLEGFPGALTMESAEDFTLHTHYNHLDDFRVALRQMYAADPRLSGVANRTLDAVDLIDANPTGDYVPGNGTVYPDTDFAETLKSVAQIIRMNLGLEAATVDLGGWDTHEYQANNGSPHQGYFANNAKQMADGLHAFWSDLLEYHGRLTVVVMSEFGRRVRENDNLGTDHGHGGLMMVLSSNVLEKKIYGAWPGLAQGQLFESVDVAATTDFRSVIGEILKARRGVSDSTLATLFPGHTYAPAGFFLDPNQQTNRAAGWDMFE